VNFSSNLPLWKIARRYTLADNFFMSAFGGSYLNHFWLICACAPKYPNADHSPAKASPKSVLEMAVIGRIAATTGVPEFEHDISSRS
jgi:phospholipase C